MFLNEKVPLSAGIAKQASAMELNSEQIQRVIEATNSIAFLKAQDVTNDRTIEFPLAKMAEVMADISIPDMMKSASASTKEPLCAPAPSSPSLVKASSEIEYKSRSLEEAEKHVFFNKTASMHERDLELLKDRAITIVPELIKAASVVSKDPQGLEKLAAIADGKEFALLSTLVYNKVEAHNNSGIFKEADLKNVFKVQALYKEAAEVNAQIKSAEELGERAKMTKQAIFGTLGKAIGSVASAPFKALGTGIGNTLANSTNSVGVAAAKAGIGHVAPVAKKIGIGTVAGKLATPIFDVAAYSPGVDKSTNTSRDVWKALQRE